MTAVPLGLAEYNRSIAHTPAIILKNMMVEHDPSNLVDGYVRIQRPGLTVFKHFISGGIRCVFRQAGTFNGDALVVSGTVLHRVDADANSTVIGDVVGSRRVQMAAGQTRSLVVADGTVYSTDGITLDSVAMPNNVPVKSVAYINGYFILTQADSQRFYWIAPGETVPDALSFASAENSPDNICAAVHTGDELWFFGEGNSTEVWIPTGNKDLPFQRVEGRLYTQGAATRDCIARLDNTLFWVGTDGSVYRADNVPVRISDHSIEELISKARVPGLRAWAFTYQGHAFYCLTIDDLGTRVYDVLNGSWSEFSSYGHPIWRAHLGAQISANLIIAGDPDHGFLWKLDQTASNDNGKPLVREVMGGVAIIGSPQPCSSFSVVAATGWTSYRTGDVTDPVLQMRFSDDGGNTWSRWYDMKLGQRGQFGGEIAKTRLGTMRAPGRMFHLRMTDDAECRISYARVNEWQAA